MKNKQYNASANKNDHSPANPRVIVYTAITGSYETLRNPDVIDPKITYACFTDTPIWSNITNSTVWKICKTPRSTLDTTRKARQIKTQPHVFLDNNAFDYSVWIDGNVNITGDIFKLIESLGDFQFAGFKHYIRNCLYSEAETCIVENKDDPQIITAQTTQYKNEGFPADNGLLETNVLIRKHNDPEINHLMDLWWEQIRTHSKRDQLSLTYACWKQGITPTLMGEQNTRGNSPYFQTRAGWRTQSDQSKLSLFIDKHIRWRFRQ